MKTPILASPLLALSLLAGCAQTQQAVKTVCDDIAQAEANPIVRAAMNAQDPHSAVGVLWADALAARNACVVVAGAPTVPVGVTAGWASEVWTGLLVAVKAAAPTVLPMLLGLL